MRFHRNRASSLQRDSMLMLNAALCYSISDYSDLVNYKDDMGWSVTNSMHWFGKEFLQHLQLLVVDEAQHVKGVGPLQQHVRVAGLRHNEDV